MFNDIQRIANQPLQSINQLSNQYPAFNAQSQVKTPDEIFILENNEEELENYLDRQNKYRF